MKIKKFMVNSRGNHYVLIDKNILELLNFGEKLKVELGNGKIIITPYYEENDANGRNITNKSKIL